MAQKRKNSTPARDRYKSQNKRELNKARRIVKYALRARKEPGKVAIKSAKAARGALIESTVMTILKQKGIPTS